MTNKKPFVIGITGTIGSGKSTVGRILAHEGIPVIDSDKVVHDLFDFDEQMQDALVNEFGKDILVEVGDSRKIDRIALGRIVFSDPAARKRLEKIVHPATIAACRNAVSEFSDRQAVAVLVPLLFEANLENDYDEIWTVFANEEVLRNRLKERDKLTDEEIDKRLAAQLAQSEKKARAQNLIDNSGTKEETERQVKTLVESLLKRLSESGA